MTRTFIALGCTAALALGLSIAGVAGVSGDADGDGRLDPVDNCYWIQNAPGFATAFCDDQEDGDSDGYGNPCDTDLNNDGATGLDDVNATLIAAITVSTVNKFDYNCDGATGLDDLNRALVDAIAVATPGPSGYACAGTVPCP